MTDASVASRTGRARLTPKEEACLRLVARRMSSKDIAAELGIAKTSVDTYCNRAREKLGVSDRYEAARLVAPDFAAAPESAPRAGIDAAGARASVSPAPAAGYIRWGLAALAILVFAEASLLAGLRALETMRPVAGARR